VSDTAGETEAALSGSHVPRIFSPKLCARDDEPAELVDRLALICVAVPLTDIGV
jgi:hypothetical protein